MVHVLLHIKEMQKDFRNLVCQSNTLKLKKKRVLTSFCTFTIRFNHSEVNMTVNVKYIVLRSVSINLLIKFQIIIYKVYPPPV